MLDVARRTYTESIDDVYLLVNQYSANHDLALSLKFSPAAGFYLSFTTATSASHIPPLFVNVVKKKNRVTCSTLELVIVAPLFDHFDEVPSFPFFLLTISLKDEVQRPHKRVPHRSVHHVQ